MVRSLDSTVRRVCFLLEKIGNRGYSYHDAFTRTLDACAELVAKMERQDRDTLLDEPAATA